MLAISTQGCLSHTCVVALQRGQAGLGLRSHTLTRQSSSPDTARRPSAEVLMALSFSVCPSSVTERKKELRPWVAVQCGGQGASGQVQQLHLPVLASHRSAAIRGDGRLVQYWSKMPAPSKTTGAPSTLLPTSHLQALFCMVIAVTQRPSDEMDRECGHGSSGRLMTSSAASRPPSRSQMLN